MTRVIECFKPLGRAEGLFGRAGRQAPGRAAQLGPVGARQSAQIRPVSPKYAPSPPCLCTARSEIDVLSCGRSSAPSLQVHWSCPTCYVYISNSARGKSGEGGRVCVYVRVGRGGQTGSQQRKQLDGQMLTS